MMEGKEEEARAERKRRAREEEQKGREGMIFCDS